MMTLIPIPKRHWATYICLPLLAAGLLLLAANVGFAKNIQKVKHKKATIAEKPIYPGYPIAFSARGHIDRIGSEGIVIDDMYFKLSGVRFNKPNNLGVSKSDFAAGDAIGMVLDKKGRLKSVWLMKAKKK